ncbi:hypothetical protein OS493_029645 [Desmophyllum pertusum]|uniref:Uncharacterized protein n=1 Tax=Desmophyllum pertusum TaxID=174260 RepID=A0A9W9ZKA4_9CNID|nr:hypothetical protein OS493_029645 [Desmophyllum pertusum]
MYEELEFGTLNYGQVYQNPNESEVDSEYIEPLNDTDLPNGNTASNVCDNPGEADAYIEPLNDTDLPNGNTASNVCDNPAYWVVASDFKSLSLFTYKLLNLGVQDIILPLDIPEGKCYPNDYGKWFSYDQGKEYSCGQVTPTSDGPTGNGNPIPLKWLIVATVFVVVLLIAPLVVLFVRNRRRKARRDGERSRATGEAAQYNCILDDFNINPSLPRAETTPSVVTTGQGNKRPPTLPPRTQCQSIDPSTLEPASHERRNNGYHPIHNIKVSTLHQENLLATSEQKRDATPFTVSKSRRFIKRTCYPRATKKRDATPFTVSKTQRFIKRTC